MQVCTLLLIQYVKPKQTVVKGKSVPYKKSGYVSDKVFIRIFYLEKTYHNSPLKR